MDRRALSHSAVYPNSFSSVWSATLKVLKDYPIEVEIRESGEIKTKEIKGYSIWEPPDGSVKNKDSRVYRLSILLEKGSGALGSAPATRVNVMKNEFENQDFIMQNISIKSNGLEESLILYRIQRELYLTREQKNFRKKQEIQKETEEEDIEF